MTYEQILLEVAQYLGVSGGVTSHSELDTTVKTQCQLYIANGYTRFAMGLDPRTKQAHRWSFLTEGAHPTAWTSGNPPCGAEYGRAILYASLIEADLRENNTSPNYPALKASFDEAMAEAIDRDKLKVSAGSVTPSDTFAHLYTEVLRHLDITSPSTDETKFAKMCVNSGYKRFLKGLDPRSGRTYQWSFLSPNATLEIDGDSDNIFELPDNFGHMVDPFVYDTGDAIDECTPYDLKRHTQATGRPVKWALFPVDGGYAVSFWPAPGIETTLRYRYRVIAPALSGDTDTYLGGALYTDAILYAAFAEAEYRKLKTIGVSDQLFKEKMIEAIDTDSRNKPRNIGRMTDGGISTGVERRTTVTYGD